MSSKCRCQVLPTLATVPRGTVLIWYRRCVQGRDQGKGGGVDLLDVVSDQFEGPNGPLKMDKYNQTETTDRRSSSYQTQSTKAKWTDMQSYRYLHHPSLKLTFPKNRNSCLLRLCICSRGISDGPYPISQRNAIYDRTPKTTSNQPGKPSDVPEGWASPPKSDAKMRVKECWNYPTVYVKLKQVKMSTQVLLNVRIISGYENS